MEGVSENTISVIKQNDPNLPEYLDFEKLRREGLEHIGNLSGKIWTDHNVHDPGITILEVLVYALLDLGYKTNLPFEDLIAKKDNQDKDDNFLTPLEILTINPVTITDYRKLLLEIEGVRNAWLEPINQEVGLVVNPNLDTLNCIDPNNEETSSTQDNCTLGELCLNGLYEVYIEKEKDADNDKIKQDVIQLLSKHRNLCEDFISIKILEPVNFGVCVDVEIRLGYDPKVIYSKIIKALKHFIQPEIRYYTLNELLDKGKTIDEIFAGRPYSKESFGFVDTDEFELLKKRTEIHLSDMYNVILSIEGIRKIKKIHIQKGNIKSLEWIHTIEDNQVPVFSIDNTCVDIYNEQALLKIDKLKILKSLSFEKKFRLPLSSLDNEIPPGVYHEDLEDYYSVQNDFPVVYGIGEDGLPDSASLLRKTQALQLKGYLMFYDQILANYTAQLANIRSLFSLKSENERDPKERKTYFTQIPETIPELEHLLRFYDNGTTQTQGTILAYPVAIDEEWKAALKKLEENPRTEFSIGNYCEGTTGLINMYTFPSVNIRSIHINQLIDSFFTKNYTIQVLEDRFGCFFILYPGLPDGIVIVGTKRYKTISEAKSAAKNVTFFAATSDSYSLVTNKSKDTSPDQHHFGITTHPISYINLIQELTENKEEYISRRKQFLDHLLARFGEEFTDYTLLQYKGTLSQPELDQEMINDHSLYINEFAELSRNRGKAFNYLEPSWNTDNVSGFEKRISRLTGLDNYHRRNLCNFEVTECYRLILRDPKGNLLFRGNTSYETPKELKLAAKDILLKLRDGNSYKTLERKLNGFDSDIVARMFCEKPTDENIIITKYHYRQKLINHNDVEVVGSKNTRITSEATAVKKREEFIKDINKQTSLDASKENEKYRLLPVDQEDCYLDVDKLQPNIDPIISWKWHVKDAVSKEKISSDHGFENEEEAWEHMMKRTELDHYLTEHKKGHKWSLNIADEKISFHGLGCYPDRDKVIAAWRNAKVLGNSSKNYVIEKGENTYRILLQNEKKKIVAVSEPYENLKEESIDGCIKAFGNRRTKPNYREEKAKIGFKIPINDNVTPLVSYCVYDSKKEALQEIRKVFELGANKKNYLLSGDEGNPEYNFLLRDTSDSFLTVPPDDFETATQRNKSLTTILRFFKDNEQPILVKEEPRKYVWLLSENENVVLKSESEFSSKARAQSNFDKVITTEALQSCADLCRDHLYRFEITSTPAEYKYVYGTTNALHELNPIFISNDAYKNKDEASDAYEEFVKKLPKLSLKTTRKNKNTSEFSLYDKSTLVAIQYNDKEIKTSEAEEHKGSLEEAKELTEYINRVYTNSTTPNDDFVDSEMTEDDRVSYEWRFYKKNAPIAKNLYLCDQKDDSESIKRIICDKTPPVDLRVCPPKQIVVCPRDDKKIYHYQVCFKDNNGKEFVLISYVGYQTSAEAEAAWQKEWLEVIKLAKDKEEYTEEGRINIKEEYQDLESKDCNEISFIAVIPKKKSDEIGGDKEALIQYYTELADLFPIYKVEIDEDELDEKQDQEIIKCKDKYKYRVVVPDKELIGDTGCTNTDKNEYLGSLLWDSVDCFDTIEEAIEKYRYFYILAHTPNNCRILCEKSKFYVGIVEVLAESSCDFESYTDAWDSNFPTKEDSCKDCIPGGVREFIYAAEDDKNYIPVCDQQYWKFKIVSPSYFVSEHNCWYNSEAERDAQIIIWEEILEKLDWSKYIVQDQVEPTERNSTKARALDVIIRFINENPDRINQICEYVEVARDCIKACSKDDPFVDQNEAFLKCFLEKITADIDDPKIVDNLDVDLSNIYYLIRYFPVYKTDKGYCYRLYWTPDDDVISNTELQPCGCDEEISDPEKACDEEYPFISSNCYSCCTEALLEFIRFCELITNKTYSFEPVSKTKYGPYSFQIIDTSRELAYHPQQYNCLQEVEDAIKMTKECIDDGGMHLLEHILLRPKNHEECNTSIIIEDEYENQRGDNCLLPICPDYRCPIEWQPDLDKDDPCVDNPGANMIHYLPGTDPYSFWATVALPSWIKCFRTEESRQIFEKLLYREVPALVGLNILWLSPKDMCKFEDEYKRWLEWVQIFETYKYDPEKINKDLTSSICEPEKGPPICSIVDCIKTLKSEPACPTIPGEQGDCDCKDDEWINDDECCLPNETKGTIFWSCCNYSDNNPVPIPGDDTTIYSLTADIKPSKIVKEKPSSASKEIKKKTVSKTKTSTSKTKKTTKKEISKKEPDHDLLTLVRQRKPKYLSNIKTLADDDMMKTKSYERTVFFLQNTPTVAGYVQLVNFFKRYSLQKDNNIEGFLGLLKNATWHVLDKLVLDQKEEIKKEEIDELQSCFKVLSEKGLSLKEMTKQWKIEDVKSLANTKPLNQIKKLVN
ncbi:hypothetical protein [Aquimarina mytili]|uniref:Uncharacterized protein n=1 Tax=Aquimarina mytili TaxID=874423 RepID=A0A936ZT65_9FLAO|nr:hypothetical protein [Aquimarina mytili]MBL0683842.1 hypothetical protein [Aquimarina mytili]